jgi:hypothetical protein
MIVPTFPGPPVSAPSASAALYVNRWAAVAANPKVLKLLALCAIYAALVVYAVLIGPKVRKIGARE